MHRAEQVVQAVAAVIAAEAGLAAAVFTHRALSLSAENQELPAVVVSSGSDEPLTDWEVLNPTTIHSQLSIFVTAYAQATTEAALAIELARLRSAVHRALFADQTLALAFVIDTRYGGADAAVITTEASPISGAQAFRFTVHYEMNLTDPD